MKAETVRTPFPEVRDDADHDPAHRGMGSTLTVAYVIWPMVYVLHIGDSRCYLMRDGKLRLLTKDQTFAQHLYDTGHLNDEEFATSGYHYMLLSAIGCDGLPPTARTLNQATLPRINIAPPFPKIRKGRDSPIHSTQSEFGERGN